MAAAQASVAVSASFAIVSPANGATVNVATINVVGTATPGARIVRDISFAADESTVTGTNGTWSFPITLTTGTNDLVFRVGDDMSTERHLLISLIAATPSASPDATEAVIPEPSEEPTPEPTEEPTEEPTPELTDELDFKPITLKGRGNRVMRFNVPPESAAIATITEHGSSNFVVWTIAEDGDETDLLVNTIGNYTGRVIFDTDAGSHTIAFKITSNGSWTIVIRPLTSAPKWSGSGTIKGKGDSVLHITGDVSGFATVKITHSGRENFVVWSYSDNGRDLLVNEIGHYSGETLLPDGTFLLVINADGAWTIRRE